MRSRTSVPPRGPLDHPPDLEGCGSAAGPAAANVVATFLEAHWGAIAGADFFTTDVWTCRGLVTYYTVFVIDLASRRVQVLGSTPVVSGNSIHLAPLRRAVIEVEKPAQPLRAAHGAGGSRWGNANDQFVLKSLMVPFVMVVRDILTDRTSQMALAQRD